MKQRYFLFAALCALLLPLSACRKDDFHAGAADAADCYRVFFPDQDHYGSVVLRRTDPTRSFTYTVCRERTDGAIDVPVKVTTSESGIFLWDDTIHFDDGAAQTTYTVRFPALQPDEEYTFSLEVTDPRYVSQYALTRRYLYFSVLQGRRQVTPVLRTSTDWNFQYYSNYFYVRAADGLFALWAIPDEGQNTTDQAFIREVIEDFNEQLEDYYASSSLSVLTVGNYASQPFAVWTFGESAGYTSLITSCNVTDHGNYLGFMLGVTAVPYCTGEYRVIKFTY